MKLIFSLMISLMVTASFAQTAKPTDSPSSKKNTAKVKKKKEGKMTLKVDIDYNPKLLAVLVPDIKKKNNFTVAIEISNKSDSDRMAKVVFYEYYPNVNGVNMMSQSKANKKRPELSVNDYIKYNREPFLLKAHTEKYIYKFDLELPKDLKGTKYAYYSVEEVPFTNYVEQKSKGGAKSAIALALSYMSPLVVDIKDTGVKKVEMSINYFPSHNLMAVEAKNIGDHYIRIPNVNLVLLNEKNELVEKMTLDGAISDLKNLHPTCQLPYIRRMAKPLKPGKYRAIIAFTGDEGLFVHTEEEELIVTAADLAKKSEKSTSKKVNKK